MLDQVLDIFNIKPDIDLNLMKKNQNLSNLTSLILNKMQKVFTKYQPEHSISPWRHNYYFSNINGCIL